jgi:hypothetical protein
MTSRSANAAASAPGSLAVAMTSRSLTLSARRRALPASSTRSAAGCARSPSMTCSAIPSALGSRKRGAGFSAMPLERVDPELVVELLRPLRPEPGQPRHVDQPGRELRAQLLERGDRAGVEERHELLLERLADAGQRRHTALPGEPRDRHRRVADGLRRVAVGDDAVDDRAVELVEIAELVEVGRDRRV